VLNEEFRELKHEDLDLGIGLRSTLSLGKYVGELNFVAYPLEDM
jgi:hypothetical protein